MTFSTMINHKLLNSPMVTDPSKKVTQVDIPVRDLFTITIYAFFVCAALEDQTSFHIAVQTSGQKETTEYTIRLPLF